MASPFKGHWLITKDSVKGVATDILSNNDMIEFGALAEGQYVINSVGAESNWVWEQKAQSSDGNLIGGTIPHHGSSTVVYRFSIAIYDQTNRKRLQGMIFKVSSGVDEGLGDDDDPGIWEADEEGDGGDG